MYQIDNNKPTLSIISPNYSEKYYRTTDNIINIIGVATDDEGVASVSINDSKLTIDSEGNFTKRVQLDKLPHYYG